MAVNVSKAAGEDYRGIVLPDPRFVASGLQRVDSSFTEAGPRPGVPVATRNTGLTVEASGTMPNTAGLLPALTVTTNRGGMPGLEDARFLWSPNYSIPGGHLSTMGWDSPTAISRHERIPATVYTATDDTYVCGCERLQDNTVALAVTASTAGGTTKVGLIYKRFDSAGYAASAGVVWNWNLADAVTSLATGQTAAVVMGTACLLQLPEGRIHVYWVERVTSITTDQYYQVRLAYLDSPGGTLTLAGKPCLLQTIDATSTPGAGNAGFEIRRMRVAYDNGQMLLLLQGTAHNTTVTYVDTLWQYGSTDLGHTFSRVALDGTPVGAAPNDGGYLAGVGSTNGASWIDLRAARGGGFVVSYITAGVSMNLAIKRLGTAFTSWLDVTGQVLVTAINMGTLASNIVQSTNTALAVDETGQLAVLFQKDDSQKSGVFLSNDGGATWLTCNATLSTRNSNATAATYVPWWENGDPSFYPTGYSCTFQCGRLVVLTSFQTGTEQEPVTDRTKLYEIDLGGYTAACRSFKRSVELTHNMVQWDYVWLPVELLSTTTGWALAGTGSEVLTAGDYSTTTTTAGQTLTITTTNVAAVASGNQRTEGVFEVQVTAGNSRLEVLVGDGANLRRFWLEFSTTNFMVKDIAGGTTPYNAAAPAAAGWNQVLFSFDWATSRLCVYVRASATDTEVRPWQQALLDHSLASAAGATASRLRVDQPQDSTARWREVFWGSGAFGLPIRASSALGTPLFGRAWTSYPVHVYSGDGVRVAAVDGPAWDGDIHTITQRHDYGISNVFAEVAPSPRRTWRSTSTAQQDFTIKLDNSADPGAPLGSTVVVAAFNCNFPTLNVSYRDTSGGGTGGFTALGTLSMADGCTGLKWRRDGHTIQPNTAAGATSAGVYFTTNALADSHVLIADGGGSVVRTIQRNTEGSWTDLQRVRPRLYCADVLATDSATGTAGEIWWKDGVLIIHDCPDLCELKFTIPTGPTAEGYFEIGTLVVGHLAYFGKQYARGRTMNWEPNFNLTTARGGSRRAQQLGPTRRTVEFSWANENETDTSQLASNPPDVDYITSGGTNPVASPADTAFKVAGLVEIMAGAVTPCVYLSKVPVVSAETVDTLLVNRQQFMLGRIVSSPRVETVLGSEWHSKGEVVRVATVTFEEEV
jgi:hypothetical protein